MATVYFVPFWVIFHILQMVFVFTVAQFSIRYWVFSNAILGLIQPLQITEN
jgi:hypothetical protein